MAQRWTRYGLIVIQCAFWAQVQNSVEIVSMIVSGRPRCAISSWPPASGRPATTTSIFQIEQTNIAEGDPANPGFAILAGDQRTRGFEFEAAGDITDQFSLLGGYSYLDAEFVAGINQGNRLHSVHGTMSPYSGNTSSRETSRDGGPASALSMSANARGPTLIHSNCRPMSAWTPL